ncbi:MAG: RAD55 family ATPase [Promethearchaeati archaeon SRVP18_Atabeyarchaeia-1]
MSKIGDEGERIRSGIVELDRILGGGLPRGTFCCVQGDIGTGTTTFCTQFVWSRLVSGGLATYVCFDETAERIIEHFKGFGYDAKPYMETKHFIIQEGHPFLNSLASAGPGQTGVMERRALLKKFLEEYNRKTIEAYRQNASTKLPAVSVVDSFSSMAPYIELKSIYVLAQMIANSARRHGNLMLAVAHTGSIEANVLCACNAAADGIIKLETNLARGVLKRLMRIEKMAFTRTPERELEYVITSEQGLQIVPQKHSI